MAETFKLPCSSYEELIKLFQAYANTKEGTALSLDEITQATGVPRTIVSKNNGFMVQVGLITEGNKKAATETGRALGRAYTSKITDEVERIWKEIIAEVDFLNRMLSAVRIRNGMDRSSFINHIIYSSGLKDAKESRAGAGALIEIFKSVGVLSEVDGKLSVLDEPSSARVSVASNTISAEQTHRDYPHYYYPSVREGLQGCRRSYFLPYCWQKKIIKFALHDGALPHFCSLQSWR